MACLHAKDLTLEDFLHLLKEISSPEGSLLMAFSPASARFTSYKFDEGFLKTTDGGRVFSKRGECQWRRVGERMRIVYLGEAPAPAALDDFSSQLEGLRAQLERVILWGVRTDLKDEWIEQQVPHRFAYPIRTKVFSRGRIVLVIEKWLDASGIPQFSRYFDLEEIAGGSHAAG